MPKVHPCSPATRKYTWARSTTPTSQNTPHELGVTQVVVCGLSASIGVESTARRAHEHGFHVTLPVDAMTDLNAATHDNSITLVFPKLGETGTTADVSRPPRRIINAVLRALRDVIVPEAKSEVRFKPARQPQKRNAAPVPA